MFQNLRSIVTTLCCIFVLGSSTLCYGENRVVKILNDTSRKVQVNWITCNLIGRYPEKTEVKSIFELKPNETFKRHVKDEDIIEILFEDDIYNIIFRDDIYIEERAGAQSKSYKVSDVTGTKTNKNKCCSVQ